MSTIVMYGNGQLSMKYKLAYNCSPSTYRSILARVEQYDDLQSTIPILTTRFDWVQASTGFSQDLPDGTQSQGYATDSGRFKRADDNGDGMADLIHDGAAGSLKVLLSTGSSFAADQTWCGTLYGYNTGSKGFQMADIDGGGPASFIRSTPRTTNNLYDSYGNVTRKKLYGYMDVTGDEREEITSYVVDTQNWRLSLPATTTVYESDGSIAARTRFDYDGNTARLLKKTFYLTGGANDPFVSYTYEQPFSGGGSTGNVATAADAQGNTTTTLYDSTHTLPQTVTNSLGHATVYGYDYRFGKAASKQDPNHTASSYNITHFEYDSLGRPKKVIGPNDYYQTCPQGVNCWTTLYEYNSFGTVGVQNVRVSSNVKSGESGYLWKELYFDGLGREIRTKAKGAEGKVIAADTTYDSYGNVRTKSLPFFFGTESARSALFQYDKLGRITTKTNPDGNTFTQTFYIQGKATFVDEKKHVKSQT